MGLSALMRALSAFIPLLAPFSRHFLSRVPLSLLGRMGGGLLAGKNHAQAHHQQKGKSMDMHLASKVTDVFQDFLGKDAKEQAHLLSEMQNARLHDMQTFDQTDLFSNRLRASVRPVVTFLAMAWYIGARVSQIPLTSEDYAIIGGIIAFWFGFRPFEKKGR